MSKGLTTKEFISKSVSKNGNELIYKFLEKHSNKYDYSKVNYVKMKDKIIIVCKEHNL